MTENKEDTTAKTVARTDADVLAEIQEEPPKEVLRQREQAGKVFTYLQGWYVKETANRIFGVENWDSLVDGVGSNTQKMSSVKSKQGYLLDRYVVTTPVSILVTLPSGKEVTKSDVGTTMATGDNNIEMAKKGAVTDGLKRAFAQFGRAFGADLYKDEPEEHDPTVIHEEGVQRPQQAQTQGQTTNGLIPPRCPVCGTMMALRQNKKTGNQFWGCPNWKADGTGCDGLLNTSEVNTDGSIKPQAQPEPSGSQEIKEDELPF